jgi:hypothetical protein
MRTKIYQFIAGELSAMDGQPVKHFDLWNNQLEFIEEEPAFYAPAVFIEFAPISWQLQGGAVYEAEVTINLHIITSSVVGKWSVALEALALIEAIGRQLHGKHFDGIDAITRTASNTDGRFGELMHNIESFSFHVRDDSAAPTRQTFLALPKINTR